MDTKPGFNGLDEQEKPVDKRIEGIEGVKLPEDGMLPPEHTAAPVGGSQPKTPEDTPEPAKTGKTKKLLVVIVAGIALWLLFKKK